MEFTGERMVPEACDGNTLWEHLYRYQFATRYVRGRSILDIACGEGYGTRSLVEAGAASVVGVDISAEACRHAKERYGVDARVGDGVSIPLPTGSLDVVVSFETIEHIAEPERFVRECARVLKPDGTFLISTPNVLAYNPERLSDNNPYHCSEMTEGEFLTLLGRCFAGTELYRQVPVTAPFLTWSQILVRRSRLRYVRGYHRLISSRFPGADPAREAAARADPVAAIGDRDGALRRLFNPYAVRPHARASLVVPLYFIAVARGPKA